MRLIAGLERPDRGSVQIRGRNVTEEAPAERDVAFAVVSRAPLEQSLAEVSPYFPKNEARALASACPLTGSAVSADAI